MVDPDNDSENENEEPKQEFDNVLDLYEYELNKKSENLTDGFYSSGEDDGGEKKQESVESSQLEDVVNAGQIQF